MKILPLFFFDFLLLLLLRFVFTESSSSEEPILFEPVGQMATSLSYLHTMITLNLSTIDSQIVHFKKALLKNFGLKNLTWITVPHKHQAIWLDNLVRDLTLLYIKEIEDLENDLAALKLSLPPVPNKSSDEYNHGYVKQRRFIRDTDYLETDLDNIPIEAIHLNHRTKRFPFLALLALVPGVLGTSLGIYNTAQMSHVWTEISSNTRKINSLIKVAEEHESFMKYLEQSILSLAAVIDKAIIFGFTLNRVTNQIKDRIHKSIHTVQQANHRRLAIDYLSPTDSTLLYSRLQARADMYSCALGIDKHSDLFQLELSYFYDGSTVTLVLHVPIFPKDSFLRLFKLHPFPLPFTQTHLIFPDTRNDILGISNLDSSYSALFNSIDLLACHRVNQLFFCERNGVLQNNLGASCLGCLYQQDFVGARVYCRFYMEPLQEYVYQLLENWFLIFSPRPQTAPIVCQNGTRKELPLSKGSSRFHLSPGCSITLAKHKVYSDLSIKLPSDFIMVKWSWKPTSIVNATKYEIESSLAKLVQAGLNRPHLTELQMLIDSTRNTDSWFYNNRHYLIDACIATAVILIVLFLGYRIYVWKWKRPSAPPMEISSPTDVFVNHYELHPLNGQLHQPSSSQAQSHHRPT